MIMDRYEHLIRIPLTRIPYISTDGAGDKTYGEPQAIKCYPDYKVTVVNNMEGVETVSNTTFYISGFYTVDHRDVLELDGRKYNIISLGTARYLDGENWLWTVYA